MANIFDVNQDKLVNKLAEELKKSEKVKAPEWSKYVKTGAHKERPPENLDWWYIRSASILKKISQLEPIGVQKLRRKYGGRKDCGKKPERFYRGSGKIIRTILQQLEKSGLVEKKEKGSHKGKGITPAGTSFLNKAAKQVK